MRSAFLRVEGLEERRLLATLYVDDPSGFTINGDQGAPGLDNGDPVTWDPGAGSAHSPTPVAGLVFGTDAFTSIQAAVDAAMPGDTIKVGSGTFAETVDVNKQLFLLGNQVDVDAQSGRAGAPETIVTGLGASPEGGTPINITASDVELNGFTVEGNTSSNAFGFGILLGAGTAGSEVRNNIVQNNIVGIGLANNSAANQTVIEQNLIRNNNNPGASSGSGIYTDQFVSGGTLTNVLIDNNTFVNNGNAVNGGAALNFSSTAAGSQTDIDISRNIFNGNARALLAFNLVNSTLTQNEVMNSNFSGSADLRIFEGVSNLLVTNNILAGGSATTFRGLRVSNIGTGAANATGITFERNSITGYSGAGLELDAGAYSGPLDAELNWWGSPTGPTIASNPGGTGEEIVDPNSQVDFIPFLTNGTDTQPGVRGFQPVIADLQVTKSDAPDPVTPGGTLTYTITVSNSGPDEVVGATVTDIFPDEFTVTSKSVLSTNASGATAGLGDINDTVTIGPGGSIVYTVGGTVSPSATGSFDNTATVTAPAGTNETDTTNNSDTETTTVGPGVADLSVVKTDSPDPVAPGANITYTLTVSSAGPSNAQTVSLTDAVPANTTFVSFAEPAGWTSIEPAVGGTGAVTSTRGTLAPTDGPQIFTLVVRVNSPTADATIITNTATVGSATGDTVPGNNTDTETTTVSVAAGLADLSVTKTDSPDPVSAGANITYTITVSNAGPNDAQSVSLTDALPAGTTFVSFAEPAGWTSVEPSVGGTGTVTSTRPALSASDGPQTFTLIVRVNPASPQGTTISNTVTVTTTSTDDNAANNTDTETTAVNAVADLRVTKTGDTSEVNPGEDLIYTIVVTNGGASDAQNVTITDVLPPGTTFVSFTEPAGWTSTEPPVGGTGTVTSSTPTLAAGASATFTLVVNVNSDVPPGTTISNSVTVTSTTTDPNSANNTDTEDTEVPPVGIEDCEVTTLNSPGDEGSVRLDDVDLDSPSENVLVVTGTSGKDVIVIEPQPRRRGVFRVVRNNRVIVTFISSQVNNIVVFALGGNDTVVVSGALNQDAKLFGDGGNDTLVGGRGNDGLDGGAGNDKLVGGSGHDVLCGGDGNDTIDGQGGNDHLGGEAGNDTLIGGAGNDLIQGNEGNDKAVGGSGNDQVFGQEGNDTLTGDNGNDIVVGGAGNDKIVGGAGRDILMGGEGADQLFGTGDDDILVGGSTAHDNDREALEAILSEWTVRSSYVSRVNNIRNGGGNNGVFTLDEITVIDDGLADTLWGQAAQDWFLVGNNDRLKDRAKNELVN
jgi:uncharacterized repeat protein (TIGR01451 family)